MVDHFTILGKIYGANAVRCCSLELEPNNPDLADTPKAKSNENQSCDNCRKPLSPNAPGSVGTWLFKGLYCSCGETPVGAKETITTFFSPDEVNTWSPPPETANHEPLRFGFPARKTVVAQARKAVHQHVRLVPPTETETSDVTAPPAVAESDPPPMEVAETINVSEIVPKPLAQTSQGDFPAGRLAQHAPEKLIGKTLGLYRITEHIGNGASGVLFKGHHETSRQRVAIKLLTPPWTSEKRHKERFLAEAKSVQDLEHDNLLALYEAGITDDQVPYIITDYFEGTRLVNVLERKGTLSEKEAIRVFMQICQGLNHAHYVGVMHRDVRPKNIGIDVDNNVKVFNCGFSKVFPDPSRETRYFTESGSEYGDARYMSPEQCRGSKTDYRSDIYSLGCLMYECLSGKTPFSAEKNSMLIYKHIKKRPRTLSSRFPTLQLSQDLENLVMRCLEKDPDNRYQSVSDLIDDLKSIESQKQVKRAFRKKLQLTPEKRDQLNIAEMLSAAVSILWFQASSTTRLLTLCAIMTALVSSSILLVIKSATQPRFNPVTTSWTRVDSSSFTEASVFRIANLRKESEELLQALRASNSKFLSKADDLSAAIIAAQSRAETQEASISPIEVDMLERRLMLLKTESGADSMTASNVIRNNQRGNLYIAPPGTSKVDTLLAAVRDKADLADADLSNADLAGITISATDLNNANFSNSDLTGATFKDVDMVSAKFDYANLEMATFDNVNAKMAAFRDASLRGSTFVNTSLEDATIHNSNFCDSDIYGGNTQDLSIIKTELDNAIMLDAGSTIDMNGTPARTELTKIKIDCEKKLARLATIANSLAILQLPNNDKILVPSADPKSDMKFTVLKTASTASLDKSLDLALTMCKTAIADARKLRRVEIVSSKVSDKPDLKQGFKNLSDSTKSLDAQIAQVNAELTSIEDNQGTAHSSAERPGFRKRFIKTRKY